MFNNNDPLKLAKDALDQAIKTEKQNKAFMSSIGPAIVAALSPVLQELKVAVSKLKVDVLPQITINPEVKIPPISIPPIQYTPPDVIVNYTPPKIDMPKLEIPPIVMKDMVWPKDPMRISGGVSLLGIDTSNPLPVQLRDSRGNPVDFTKMIGGGSVAIGGGGGKTDFFTLKDIQTSAGASIIDQEDGAMKVVGNLGISGITNSVAAALVDSAGNQYSGSNPLPITGALSLTLPSGPGDQATATRVTQAGDSVSSVYVNNPAGAGELATALRVTQAGDSVSSIYATNPFGPGEQATALRVVIAGDSGVTTTASLSVPQGPGDGATAMRVIQAGDTVSSVYVNNPVAQGDAATALRVVVAGNSDASVVVNNPQGQGDLATALRVVIAGNSDMSVFVNNPVGLGDAATALRVTTAGNAVTSVAITGINGPVSQGDSASALRTIQAGDSVSSVNVVGPIAQGDAATALRVVVAGNSDMSVYANNPVNQGDVATALRVVIAGNSDMSVYARPSAVGDEKTADVLRVYQVSDSVVSAQNKLIAMTTLPAATSDAASGFQRSDKYGRALSRPIQVRDLVSTAYVSLSTGTEATLLAAVAGQTFDLIWILLSNQSTAAVQVDVRPVNAGNIAMTFQVPANQTVGIAPPVPLLGASDTGNAWTVDMPDITGTTVNISALFSREI